MIGPGKAFDTDRFFVVSTNLLGGCRGTTGPSSTNPATGRPYGSDFPVITVADMVRAERAFLDELGITRLAAVAGGSLGGMQALEWAVRYPDQVDAIIPIASTHALQPQGVAWNAIARNAITADPDWQGGHYYGTAARRRPAWAWRAWSATSRICRRRRSTSKFGRRLQFADDIRYALTEPEFEVESYLRHQAETLREALRRQHLSLHVAGAVLLRPRAAVRRRPARARGARRVGADAAHRVQLRLAVSAVGFRGAGDGAARGRQGRRAARDRRAVRARLLSVGGGAPDADDSGVPRSG